jgi:hypothetical protein
MLIQCIKNSVFSVYSVVSLLNRILSQSRTILGFDRVENIENGTRCVPYDAIQ